MPHNADHVDGMVAAWSRSAPHLDVEPLEVVGRLLRLAALLMRTLERTLAERGLSYGDFDVLSTVLRENDRAGMNPSHLARSALITTGAMTSRLDRLERLALISRTADDTDRRAVRIRLTDDGRTRAEAATDAGLDVDRQFLQRLSPAQRSALTGAPAATTAHHRQLMRRLSRRSPGARSAIGTRQASWCFSC